MKQEAIDAFNREQIRFNAEINQRNWDRAEAVRQFNANNANAKTQIGIDKQRAFDQASQFKRQYDIQEAQFARQQNFLEAQNQAQLSRQDMQFREAQRQFGVQGEQFDRQLAATEGQFTRQQNFAEQQAQQDALYRAIGTILAAEDSGINLGIGTGPYAPGGLPGLLRAELGNALGIDLTRMGYLGTRNNNRGDSRDDERGLIQD